MAWRECKRCQRRLFYIEGQPLPLEGYCEACYEAVTGKCAMCAGTGQIERAHLGKSDCLKCDGSGQAIELDGESD
jgi:DnaJ-class molecular chaperone